jgi:hypothetical protein
MAGRQKSIEKLFDTRQVNHGLALKREGLNQVINHDFLCRRV